jgi:hypothetical protein
VINGLREQTQALPVVPEDLDQIASAATEDKQMARTRIALERLLRQQGEATKTFAHVGVAGGQPRARRRAPGSCQALHHLQHPPQRFGVTPPVHANATAVLQTISITPLGPYREGLAVGPSRPSQRPAGVRSRGLTLLNLRSMRNNNSLRCACPGATITADGI